ncbi:MAG: hypothetical protein QGG54_13770 [Gammaproteobacteria bacterium]|jgi:thiol-disulfide isomerase/thioredoxin|nr:hypothetical protein [Gammaproteobacteria bacterium]MDP6535538.1 hypothetical protein [Gammaproteobacteria bacterium]MDP6733133.1 hypothetical protein [Gammaproteobacteria bacterium]HAJ74981.1 hypothetical protein [Gammaproteobacteria bacterium]|tara:strand:+ start:1079 stop:1579 length:501 start_codon:yes stop_codon:yes gene_type:complete
MAHCRTKLARALALSLAVGLWANSYADHFKAFTTDSFEAIKSEFAGREFLMGLWSSDCLPCFVELEMMGSLLQLNPDLPFVLISTDSIEQREFAEEFLEDFQLSEIESWMFADSFVERLRYSIDPNWYGELPRSYFFDANHEMSAHSGIMSQELLTEWFSEPVRFE